MSDGQEAARRAIARVEAILKDDAVIAQGAIDRPVALLTPLQAYPDGGDPRLRGRGTKPRGAYYEVVKQAFSHHTANPSQPVNRRVWETIYAYGCQAAGGDGTAPLVNDSPESLDQFVRRLVCEAHRVRDFNYDLHYFSHTRDFSTESQELAIQTRHVLLGDRGIGKTTFVNWMLATRCDDADREGVIIVRFDCAAGNYKGQLSDLLKAKLCKILLKYYDASCEREDLQPAIQRKELRVDLSLRNVALRERMKLNGYNPEASGYEAIRAKIRDAKQPLGVPSRCSGRSLTISRWMELSGRATGNAPRESASPSSLTTWTSWICDPRRGSGTRSASDSSKTSCGTTMRSSVQPSW